MLDEATVFQVKRVVVKGDFTGMQGSAHGHSSIEGRYESSGNFGLAAMVLKHDSNKVGTTSRN